MKKLMKLRKTISMVLIFILVNLTIGGCSNNSDSKTTAEGIAQESNGPETIKEKETKVTEQITVTTSTGETLTFDASEVETTVAPTGEITYKVDGNTSVTVAKVTDTITGEIVTKAKVIEKAEDGTIAETIAEKVTVKQVVTEVETQPTTQAPTQPGNNKPVDVVVNTPVETNAPTSAPTQPVTDAPTQPVTNAPTDAPTQPVTQAPTNAPPVETQAPTEAPTNPPETEPYVEPTEAPTQPYIPPAPWTLDVADYQAKLEAKLRAAGKVTIREYCLAQGVPAEMMTDNTGGAGFDEAYVNKSTYQWNLDVAAVGVNNAYYIEYRGIDNNGFYVFRFYRI
ncbi:hypothetical protein [[Clostridium] fimetarium]|uniref:Uncharacterized protein n=1 Tax=[Clostridium] fimetarium TaxID=99656 RepID=A0A1I0QVQ4_9FIRM|nr:hypothetical protein [[Clostridium] fimetarium]SEW31738.1 hypothetical protein SAMN05421659_109177 [[Clostridium] fimetarium]